jgi:ABC-type multidrug transport system ATPase subunit
MSSRTLDKQGKILINGKDSTELTVPLSILSAYVQ